MTDHHNSSVGHFGAEKTINKLLDNGHRWDYMRKHVKAFIKKCPCCQLMSRIKPSIHAHKFTTATYNPMESLNIDTIGPLPPDEIGNTYIIVIIDRFSRWIELIPATDATSLAAARALLHHCGRYGIPQDLLSDGGSQYVNEIIQEFLNLIGTEHKVTIAYSKEENSIVERSNKEVLRHLKNIVFDKRVMQQWSIYLPLVMRIYNASIHSSLGVSPSQILFGNALNLDRLLFPTAKEFSIQYADLTLSQYVADLISAQDIIVKIAQNHQHEKDQRHLSQPQSDETVFEINSFVLVAYPDTGFTQRPRPPNKLMTDWKGPYKVIARIGASYTLLNLVTMKEESGVHVQRLKHFEYDEHTDPRLVANQANDTWDVEAILGHTGQLFDRKTKKDTRKNMTFLVKWVGFETPTSEPYSNRSIFKTRAMHEYLNNNKLKTLIPAAHK